MAYKYKIYSQSSDVVYKPHLSFSFKCDIQAANDSLRLPLNGRTKLIAIPVSIEFRTNFEFFIGDEFGLPGLTKRSYFLKGSIL